MSLQAKFAILISCLALAVVGSLVAAIWALNLYEAEVARPLERITIVLRDVKRLRAHTSDQSTSISRLSLSVDTGSGTQSLAVFPPVPDTRAILPPDRLAKIEAVNEHVRAGLTSLDSEHWYVIHAGSASGRAVRARAHEAAQAVDALTTLLSRPIVPIRPRTPVDAAARRGESVLLSAHLRQARSIALTDLADLDRIAARIEREAVEQVELAAQHGDQIKFKLTTVLVSGVVIATLLALLQLVLVRRWVLAPIARLRVAAAEIAKGNLDHRIPPVTKDEFGRLSTEVNHMTSRIQRLQEDSVQQARLVAVGEMVRRITHNLRNTLAGIRGLAELTRAELGHAHELSTAQGRIITTVDRFESWIGQLLHATRPLDIDPAEVSVRQWLPQLVEALRDLANSRGVRLSATLQNAPSNAEFDPRHLEHALVAIISNAIDACSPGGSVDVNALASDDGSSWEIRVSDTGPGVPAELRAKVFNAYFTTKPHGTGIGLAVAHQVVRAHGGDIHIGGDHIPNNNDPTVNTQPHGAIFIVRLPTKHRISNIHASASIGH